MITGATGHLGRLVVEELLARDVPVGQIVASGRSVDKIADLAARGVEARHVDFGDGDSLTAAFAGVDALLLVSTTTVGERVDNHRRAIDAARAAGVARIVYTSALNADTAQMRLADEHLRTEEYLAAGGAGVTVLRNGWYLENYTDQLPVFRRFGAVFGAARDGRVSAAARADYAAAAATVLLDDAHTGHTYELGGDASFTLAELATVLSEATGEQIGYTDLPEERYAAALTEASLPTDLAAVLADADTGLARGELQTDSTQLRELIGRPTTRLTDAVANALA